MITIRVKNNDYQFVKPYYLMPTSGLRLIKAKVKGSLLVWNIEGEQITYNQIKQLSSHHETTTKMGGKKVKGKNGKEIPLEAIIAKREGLRKGVADLQAVTQQEPLQDEEN